MNGIMKVMEKKRIVAAPVLLTAVLFLSGGAGPAWGADGLAEVKRDFDTVCANSTNGDTLGKEELQKLINQCDKLKPRIEKLEDSDRRFYLRRLKSCRDLYQFMLDTADREKSAAAAAPAAK